MASFRVDFKHIDFNVKIQAPFKQKKIGIIAGGTSRVLKMFGFVGTLE